MAFLGSDTKRPKGRVDGAWYSVNQRVAEWSMVVGWWFYEPNENLEQIKREWHYDKMKEINED